ncbi:MAG: 30S ribosomal protein S13 [Candidatus Aenigmarchaeota archaeon]|nr:30S ribosomal protein S13 [Candidatus Aenigmarchaeota archaeon]
MVEKNEREMKGEMKEIVRVLSTDLNGKKKIKYALRRIKGISFAMAKVFCKKAGIDPDKLTGYLKEDEVEKLENVIKNPEKFGIPEYLFNLRKHPRTGESKHLNGAELQIETRQIITSMEKLGDYRGMRHRRGLPVRGQRTRSSFRKSSTVGVVKKKSNR